MRPTAATDECFTVTPVTPALDTQAGGFTVDFGQPVHGHGDARRYGATSRAPMAGSTGPTRSINATNGAPAGGTITFTLLKANCTTLATGTGTNPQP